MNNQVQNAIEILRNGGIGIFPTDTAFGIGCRIDDEHAVERLFELRKRPVKQATPVLVSSVEMAKEYVSEIPKDVEEKLIKKYWSGALTIILSCRTDKVPQLVRGGGLSIGLRMPRHEVLRNVIQQVGVPILGPSANFHGEKTPYVSQDLDEDLKKLVDFILPGKTSAGNISTVIDCTVKPWKVLRKGAISVD